MADTKRNIAVVTGTRADYGLLRPTLRQIVAHDGLELALLVTGTHLSPRHGRTVQEIERDGIEIAAQLPILGESSSEIDRLEMAHALGRAVTMFADTLSTLRPDVVLLFGDRYEMLAAAQASLVLGFPIAHIAGGERSEGAVDEAFRHSITKMSTFHFVSTDSHRRRVLQLGEQPESVVTVGALVLDSISSLKFESKETVCDRFGLDPAMPLFIATLHSETLTGADPGEMADALIAGLAQYSSASIIFTASNADAGGDAINTRLKAFAHTNGPRIQFHESLGHDLYLKVVKVSDVVIGNSSSGVIEAPILGVPTVNIGARQQGRTRCATVVDSEARAETIADAIRRATARELRTDAARSPHPFGSGSPSKLVVDALHRTELDRPVKQFRDS